MNWTSRRMSNVRHFCDGESICADVVKLENAKAKVIVNSLIGRIIQLGDEHMLLILSCFSSKKDVLT
ncbi:hypothetical protein SLA2020_021970 [Shorea laevis]